MEILIILLFGGAIAVLWQRMDKLDRQVAGLSRQLDQLRFAPSAPLDAPQSQPAEAAVAIPEPAPVIPDPVPVQAPLAESEPEPEPAIALGSADHEPYTARLADKFSFDFEDIFGRRLPIWGGGFALAIAGIFLVRFAIEAGLLTPAVRVALSFVFGLTLLAAAELAYRFDERLADPRVRQSLAGAGLATLYGAFYLAGTAYGLIGAGAAFVGLAGVTAGAIGLSLRFGLPSAVIGLVGGFAAPLLVDSDSANVPLLSFYLALITGGLAWSGQAQGRAWLGYAALAAGLGWGVLMMLAGVSSTSDFAALGVYLIVLGTVLPAALHARNAGPRLPHLIAGGLATLQMAVLVSNAGFAPLTWGLYLLIGAALAGLGWRFAALRLGTVVAAGLGLWLLVIWPDPDPQFLALVAAAIVAIFAGVPLAHHALGRAQLLDLAQLAAVSVVMGIVIFSRYGSWDDTAAPGVAACMAGLALLPAAGFALLWRRDGERPARPALILLAPAALLAFAALLLVTPAWLAPVMAALVAAALLWLHARRDAAALHGAAWAGALAGTIALVVTPQFAAEATHLGDAPDVTNVLRAAIRWAAGAAPLVGMALITRMPASRAAAEAGATALIYGLIAQLLPSVMLAWIAAAGAMALFMIQPARVAAWTSALAIAAAWALLPVATWATAGLLALLGEPFLADSAIAPFDLGVRVLPLAAALGMMAWRGQEQRVAVRAALMLGLGGITVVMGHSLYKQIFVINSLFRFEHYGMGERTVWQAGLLVAAWGAAQRLGTGLRRPVSLGLIAAALLHFGWFTLMLHNPLLSVQHVGPTPIANWLTLAYLTALAAVWLGRQQWGAAPAIVAPAIDAAVMALVALLAYSLLRQVFAGSVLTARAIDQTESLLISLLGIVLALGFLWWGSWRALRSWRIGSLVLMLAAVIKVFLVDAAGLGGLLRIASFMALGFSLIGIGWVYSRQLSQRPASAD